MIRKITIAVSFLTVVAFAVGSPGCSHRKMTVAEQQQKAASALREATLKTVTDPERAQRAAMLNDELLNNLTKLNQDAKDYRKEIQQLNAKYDTTDQAYKAFFDRLNARITEHQNTAIDIHQQLMLLLTPEEWEHLSKVRDKAVEAYLKSIR